jgi:hypothetical protein
LPVLESKRHRSIAVAFSEKIAKFTPSPSQVAPSGKGLPGYTMVLIKSDE